MGPSAESAAPSAQSGDAEDTLAHWQRVWEAYKQAKAQQQGAGRARKKGKTVAPVAPDVGEIKAAAPSDTPSTSAAAKPRSAKQAGSKARPEGYNHHLPTGARHLPNAVGKGRMRALFEAIRGGRKYSEDDRRKSLARRARGGLTGPAALTPVHVKPTAAP